jgi:Putative outer membrane beta-barrel porin, MtrB/PioB
MRNRLMMGTAALLLASATFAWAQDKPQEQSTAPSNGTIDVGGRFTSTTGDEARYQRYRDLRNGANVNFVFNKETANWTFDAKATNIGYRDGRYAMNFNSRRLKVSFLFDSTPLNYSYETSTPYNCTVGNCGLDVSLRNAVQAKTAIGVPATVANLIPGSIYDTVAKPFDLQSRRDTLAAEARFSATDNLDLLVGVKTYKRSGNMPYGASFAFNVATELPVVIDNRETEVSVGAEWASHQGMFHVGYEHSKFQQNIPSFTFDNPNFATSYCKTGLAGQAPGACYDPSGYSNGNGPAYGRMSMAPSNTLDTVNWMGMVKLPGHTTANGSFSTSINRQDEALIPWTTNPTIANATVYKTFPGLAALPRDTADMHVNYATGTMNVNSRPSQYVTLTARYRFNSRSDFTRPFDATEYVRFDAVPEETGGETEPFDINRNTFDFTASFTPIPFGAVRVGYGYDKWEHTVRFTEGWKDNTARVSFDTVGNQYVTLRAQYEHTKRDSIGLNIADLVASGAQDATRIYDEASRKRDRGTLTAEFTPMAMVGVNVSVAAGKDDYQGADPTQQFGLLNNKNTAFTAGVTVSPNAKVNVGADYGRETYNSLQQSRNANPAPDPSWTDPSRNWTLANDETVNTFSLYADLIKPVAKTDVHVAYDYSDSDQGFVHGGPRIPALAAIGQFIALPNVTNKWHHLTFDVTYSVSKQVGVGFSYLYEKFDVADFATINTAGPDTLPLAQLGPQTNTPRIDWLGSINTGYGNRPYTGSTGIVRVFYLF